MKRNTSVSLGEYLENFIEHSILEGRYKSVSDTVRAGLRLLEKEDNAVKTLKNAIQEGIDSGIAKNFDPQKHLALLKADKEVK